LIEEAPTGTAIEAVVLLGVRLRIFRLLTAIGLGATAAYLLDPESGEKRRKELRKGIQKAKKMGRKARIEAGL